MCVCMCVDFEMDSDPLLRRGFEARIFKGKCNRRGKGAESKN